MLWVKLLCVILALLSENVQAADSYFGNNRNWNLRRPIALQSRPNPVVNPIHTIPKPLPQPIEAESIHEDFPETTVSVPLETKPIDNYHNQPTIRSNYRLLPQRDPLPLPSTPETSVIGIATEPTTVDQFQTTSLYTNPPEIPTADDIEVIKTRPPASNPSLRHFLMPRPLSKPVRIEQPQPTIENEITSTAALISSLPTVSPDTTITIIDNPRPETTVTLVSPESQPTTISPITEPELITKPEEPEIEILVNTPKEEPTFVNPTVLEEKLEDKPEVVVVEEEEPIRTVSGYAVVRNTRPIAVIPIKRPEIGSRPYRVPKPVVSSPRPTLMVTPPHYVKPTPPKVIESKPILKSILPLNPEPEWTTPAPKQLYDYQCEEADGYYGIAGDCDNYVECKKYVAILLSCPDGLHYNPRARWPEYPCGYPSEVKCESNSIRQVAHPTDECPQQYGFYPMPDSDCSRYIMCQEGRAFIMDCPPGLAFSVTTSSCDWPENVPSCRPDVFHGFTCPAPALEEDGSPSDMIFKYRYRESCKEYIACQRGHPRLLRCDAGMSFDEESEVCVDSDYVNNCKY